MRKCVLSFHSFRRPSCANILSQFCVCTLMIDSNALWSTAITQQTNRSLSGLGSNLFRMIRLRQVLLFSLNLKPHSVDYQSSDIMACQNQRLKVDRSFSVIDLLFTIFRGVFVFHVHHLSFSFCHENARCLVPLHDWNKSHFPSPKNSIKIDENRADRNISLVIMINIILYEHKLTNTRKNYCIIYENKKRQINTCNPSIIYVHSRNMLLFS